MVHMKIALASLALISLSAITIDASANTSAAPAKSPILVKRQTTISASGKSRSSECRVFTDGVTIDRNIDGVTTAEEKTFKMAGTFEAKIDEVSATAAQTKVIGPLEFSYDMVAYRTSASGVREEVILSSFDGVKGVDTFNPSSAAIILKDVLNSVCGN